MRVPGRTTPAQFLQSINAVVNGPGWGTCPAGIRIGAPRYRPAPANLKPLPPLVDTTGRERTAEKTGRKRYSCSIGGIRVEERVKRPTHDVLSAVYAAEKLMTTRSSAALRSAGADIPPPSSAEGKRLSLYGRLTIEQMAAAARNRPAGGIRQVLSEFAMDFAAAAENVAGSGFRGAASLAFFAGALFVAGRRRGSWAHNASAAFDFSSRHYLMSGNPALSAIAGEIALKLSPHPATSRKVNGYTTAEVTAAAWNHVMISPSASEPQQMIALHRGLRAALLGRVWYSAGHFYSMSASLLAEGRLAAREHVRSAWTEALDVAEGKMLFFESRIESKLRTALLCLNGAKRAASDAEAIRGLLAQAELINGSVRKSG